MPQVPLCFGGSRVSGGRKPRIDPVVRLIRVDGGSLLIISCLEFSPSAREQSQRKESILNTGSQEIKCSLYSLS